MSEFSDPDKNIARLQLKDGMSVADFGAGTGYNSVAASRRIGARGKVYAIEVQKELLIKLRATAAREHCNNIEVVWGNLDSSGGSRLRDESIDAVIISNVLFQAEMKDVMVAEAVRVLKVGGKILLVEWADSFGNLGPKAEHIVRESVAREYFEAAGMRFVEGFDAGAHHYADIFIKETNSKQ
ncbi:MAG: methyltransferase domain-containing protein [Candidatus Vogelbacteria bacterium]|nr:methyltransferase domain-containing protein [Candidatus Vogelbacteria bacterium]